MGQALRILFVDDDPADLELMDRISKQAANHCVVGKVQHPEQLALALEDPAPHLVFVDHYLGPLTGTDLIRRYQARYPHIPFVLLTGRSDEHVAVEAIRAGARDYLRKQEISSEKLKDMFERFDPARQSTWTDTMVWY